MRATIQTPAVSAILDTDLFQMRSGVNDRQVTFANMVASVTAKQTTTTVWTPVVAGVTAAGTATYTTRAALCTKVNSMVYFTCNIVYTSFTGTGGIKITGFPYAAASTTGYVYYTPVCPVFVDHTTAVIGASSISVKNVMAKITAGANLFTIIEVGNSTTETTFTATSGSINFAGFIFV